MKPSFDLSVYLVTDEALCRPRSVEEVVERAISGGATVVQIRDKEGDAERLRSRVGALRDMLRRSGARLILNDHVELARSLEVDGVHLGQSDTSPRAARRILGAHAIIGLSITGAADLESINPDDVDYIGLGPVFATSTKPDIGVPIGLEGFRRLRSMIELPVVAIGGIDRTNAVEVVEAGADGVAVVSAICAAPDAQHAARALREAVRSGKRRRS